jgi:O-antigen ligase
VAGALLATVPVIAAVALGSRGEVVAAMPIVLLMLVMAMVGPGIIRQHRWALAVVGVVAVTAPLAIMVWKGILTIDLIRNVSGRTGIWRASLRLIGEEPWLGVGPDGYGRALRARNLAQHVIGAGSAHNLFLHIAAEIGLAGAALWIAFLYTLVRDCWRVALTGTARVSAACLTFMLALMSAQWMVETFIEGSFLVERHRLLAWLVFAAAVAMNRAGQDGAFDRSAPI